MRSAATRRREAESIAPPRAALLVVAADGSALALKLETPLAFQRVVFDVIVVQSRHVGASLSDLLDGRKVDVNATPVVQGTEDPFEAAKRWRAWHLIAQVMLNSSDHTA